MPNGSISSRNASPAGFVHPALAIRNAVSRAAASPAVMFRSIDSTRLTADPVLRMMNEIIAEARRRVDALYAKAECADIRAPRHVPTTVPQRVEITRLDMPVQQGGHKRGLRLIYRDHRPEMEA